MTLPYSENLGTQHAEHHTMDEHAGKSATDFWEGKYAGPQRVWSGKPNHCMVQIAAGITPGRSLDLGCGEGADVIWLASLGWRASGYDISTTALARASKAAAEKELSGNTHFEAVDLDAWANGTVPIANEGPFQLITASFLQSPIALDRIHILQHAAGLLSRGGRLVIISHAAPPSWAPAEMKENGDFPTPDDELTKFNPDKRFFTVELAEIRHRTATDPDGNSATMDDTVVCIRRHQ